MHGARYGPDEAFRGEAGRQSAAAKRQVAAGGASCSVSADTTAVNGRRTGVEGASKPLDGALDAPDGLRSGHARANSGDMGAFRKASVVVQDARRALLMSQAELAQAIGSSHRTVGRSERGQAMLSAAQLGALASLVHPRARDLAIEVAAHAGHTLETLGLEAPAPPPGAPPAAGALRARTEDLCDVLVLAGVIESGAAVADVRRWVHAVMKRACDVGLTVEEVEKALRPAAAPPAGHEDLPRTAQAPVS
jgi:ribosome-binding protein aMBF1 (putative translation factor)